MAEIRNGIVWISGLHADLEPCVSDLESCVSDRLGTTSTNPGLGFRRRPSFRMLPKSRSPSPKMVDLKEDGGFCRSFLDSCSLCKRDLVRGNCDLFMYKGEMAFCSEECREEYMEMEEVQERRLRKLTMKASREAKSATANGVHATATSTVVAG